MEFLSLDPSTMSLKLKTETIPEPGPDEIRVKVAYAGICGTDLHILEGSFPAKKDGPITLGHEFVGTVDQIGKNVNTFKIGQRVAVDPNAGCDKCTDCHGGNYQFCSIGGLHNTIGIFRNGGWSTHAIVPESQVSLIPDGVEMYQAVLAEPMSCLAHGWDLINPVNVGNKVLVIGAGIIGLLWTCMLHLRGLRKTVTISEPQERRRQIVSKLDFGYKAKHPDELKESEFDIVIDCSGSGPAMEAGFRLLRPGGRLCIFGVANPKTKMTIAPYDVFKKELSILGVNINPYTFPKSLSLLEAMSNDDYLDYNKLGIKIFPLSKYREALDALKMGNISKAVFKF